MSSIQPVQQFSLLPTPKVTRILGRLSTQTQIGVAVTDAKAELESAKVHAVAQVASSALQDVALLSQVEQSLAQAVPHASGRLATIADLTAIAVTDLVTSAARRIGR